MNPSVAYVKYVFRFVSVVCNHADVTETPRPLVSTAEAAASVGLSPVTLARYAREGRVKPATATRGEQRATYRWDIEDLRRQLSGDDTDD